MSVFDHFVGLALEGNKNRREQCKICSKITVNTPDFNVVVLVFSLLTPLFTDLIKISIVDFWTGRNLSNLFFLPCFHLVWKTVFRRCFTGKRFWVSLSKCHKNTGNSYFGKVSSCRLATWLKQDVATKVLLNECVNPFKAPTSRTPLKLLLVLRVCEK